MQISMLLLIQGCDKYNKEFFCIMLMDYLVGSSSNMIVGSVRSSQAMMSLFRSPPDRRPALVLRTSWMPSCFVTALICNSRIDVYFINAGCRYIYYLLVKVIVSYIVVAILNYNRKKNST